MFRAIISIILWPIGAIIFLIGAIVYSVSIVFSSPNNLHPLARVLARIFMFFGGQWFRVKANHCPPKSIIVLDKTRARGWSFLGEEKTIETE
jgi:hypothetical protein